MKGYPLFFIFWNSFCLICATGLFAGSAFVAPSDETLFRLLALSGGFFFLWICRRYWCLVFAFFFFLSLFLFEAEKIIASIFVFAFAILFVVAQQILILHYAGNWKQKNGKWVNPWGKSWIYTLLFHDSSSLPKKYLWSFFIFVPIMIRACHVAMSRSEWLFLFAYMVGIFFLLWLFIMEQKKSMEFEGGVYSEEEARKKAKDALKEMSQAIKRATNK